MKTPDINLLAILSKTKLKAFLLWLRRIALAEFNNNRLVKPAPIASGILLMALSGQVFASFWFDTISNRWYYRFINEIGDTEEVSADYILSPNALLPITKPKSNQKTKTSPLPQIPNSVYHNAYQIDTESFTTDAGEPLVTGMTRTFGRFYKASRNERVVLNTYGSTRFGSDLDTMIAVYRIDFSGGATGADALKRVAVNDDKNLPGFKGASLVQFDAHKGEYYAIQVGSKNEGGDVLLTGFTFPQSGGLTIQPLNAYGGYSYSCNIRSGYDGNVCEDASYIVYNSTDKTLAVTASTDLTEGFTAPKSFTLVPGAAAVKTFTYNPALFNQALQTLSGGFSFTGKAAGKVVAQITMPARVSIHASTSENPTLKLTATPNVLSGTTGDVFTFPVTIKNVGSVPAIGCYVTNSGSEITLQTAWAAYDLKTQQVVGDANIPFDIAVGKSATILVAMRSFTDRLADPTSQSPVEIGCANGETFFNTNRFDLTNKVDFTNTISQYPKLNLLKTTPQNSILNISAPGKVFTATFRNDSDTTAEVTAVVNEQSFNYETGQIEAFGVAVCSASTTDADCLGSTEHELPLLIDAGKNVTVKVAVRYPAESYGFSPKKGVSLLLKHGYDAGGFVLDGFIPLTGLTKALKRSN